MEDSMTRNQYREIVKRAARVRDALLLSGFFHGGEDEEQHFFARYGLEHATADDILRHTDNQYRIETRAHTETGRDRNGTILVIASIAADCFSNDLIDCNLGEGTWAEGTEG